MDVKVILTIAGIVLSIVAPLPYIRDIVHGATKPHVITWLILTVLVSAAFIIQLIGGGAFGSWVLGATAFMNLVIFLLCLRNPKDSVSRFDLILLVMSGLALILWIITSNPLLSAILFTLILTAAFIPTFRKSLIHPRQETISLYLVSAGKQILGIAGLSAHNPLTLLFPIAGVLINMSLVVLLTIRRRQLKV